MVSIPLSVYTSRISLGRRLRQARLFVIPEELRPPEEIRAMMQSVRAAPMPPGFIEAVVDPVINALTCAAGVARFSKTATLRSGRQQLVRSGAAGWPGAIDRAAEDPPVERSGGAFSTASDVWTSAQSHALWRDAIASSGMPRGIVGPAPHTFDREPARSAMAA